MNPRDQVIEFCRLAWASRLMAACDGNISVRHGHNMLITPSGRSKALVRAEELVEVEIATGRVISGRRPSTESGMHRAAYLLRNEIGSVVHAHPPTAMAFSLAGRDIPTGGIPEVLAGIGDIGQVGYYTTGSAELARAAGEALAEHRVLLLAMNGSLAVGRDLEEAWVLTERLEQAARMALVAEQLGGPRQLPAAEQENLRELGRRMASAADATPPPTSLDRMFSLEVLPETDGFAKEKRARDQRGQAHLIVDDLPLRRVCYLTLKPGAGYRGGHYHLAKNEWLYVAAGRARVELAAVHGGERRTLELGPGARLWLGPGVAHRLEALEELHLVEFTDSPYQAEDDRKFDFDA